MSLNFGIDRPVFEGNGHGHAQFQTQTCFESARAVWLHKYMFHYMHSA